MNDSGIGFCFVRAPRIDGIASSYDRESHCLCQRQIVILTGLRRRHGIEAGPEFEIERLDCGKYLLQRRSMTVNESVVQGLLKCPTNDWFVPIGSESTAAI